MKAPFFVILGTLFLLLSPSSAQTNNTFQNPIFAGQDPYLQFWQGNYYYSESDGDRIAIRKSPSLLNLGAQPGKVIWTSPKRGWNGHANIWAPEIHLVDGIWYIYYAADFATDGNHRLYVLQGGAEPLDPYTQGETGAPDGQILESTGQWAIDPNVFTGVDHILYLTWSCADDPIGATAQSLCLASMPDPLHVGSATTRISTPSEAWERRSGNIQEGPVGLVRNGTVYITYSASASWTTNDYCVGILRNLSGDLTNPLAWEKRGPILDGKGKTYGPGSVVFTESPDGSEPWVLFHAYDRLNCRPWGCRSIRMQRFDWSSDGWPEIGNPVDPGTPIPKPSGTAP